MVLGAGAGILVLSGVRATAWLVGPVFLALMIVIAVYPVQAVLRRHGWPPFLATVVLVLLAVGVLVAVVLVVVVSLARLAALLPQYSDRADDLLGSLAGSLAGFGVQPEQLQEAVTAISLEEVVAIIGSVLAGLSGTLSSLVLAVCLLLFLSVDAGGIERRLAGIAAQRPELASSLRLFARGTRSYLVVSTVFGLIVGVLDTVALAIIGVPLPVLWGVLSFITNYIPNIGFVVGLVPPALLALLTLGVPEMLLVIATYCLLNFVIQSLIQPHYVGDSVGLATTTTFVALVFWAWLIGPLGALLAIPLTLLVKALLVDVDPAARWASALVGSLAAEPRPPRRGRGARRGLPRRTRPPPEARRDPARSPAGDDAVGAGAG